jgi:hypothetical protein
MVGCGQRRTHCSVSVHDGVCFKTWIGQLVWKPSLDQRGDPGNQAPLRHSKIVLSPSRLKAQVSFFWSPSLQSFICVSINFWHFLLLFKRQPVNINQTPHKLFCRKGYSSLLRCSRVIPTSKGEINTKSAKNMMESLKNLFFKSPSSKLHGS